MKVTDQRDVKKKKKKKGRVSVIKTMSDAVKNWTTRQGDGGRGFKA